MKYLFWPPVMALVVVLMLCTGLLRIVFHLVWDFRFMRWREAYTFDGDYLFKDHSWKDVLMEIINPYYVVKDKNEEEDEDENEDDEDEDVKPNPKFDNGQLGMITWLTLTIESIATKYYLNLEHLRLLYGKTFRVIDCNYHHGAKTFYYLISGENIYEWIPEELLVEYVKPVIEL